MDDAIFPHKEILHFINETLDMKQFTMQVNPCLLWYESNLFLSGLDHLFNLGFEKSHRKLRPGGLCSHPARPWVQHWLDACSINGADGLPWSSRGNKWTIQPYFCLLMLYLMIWGFVMVNFHSWFEFNILCANCLRKKKPEGLQGDDSNSQPSSCLSLPSMCKYLHENYSPK